MPIVQNNALPSVNERVDEFISVVTISRHMGLKPMCAISILEVDGVHCGALLTLYAAEAHALEGKMQNIPLTPYFYHGEVATELELRGLIVPVHETRKTGVSVTWCDISSSVI